ncbi:MAG TPA: A24 family peptidase [Candidatus Udaeobacter sp.]|jgi:prepilin peptidase CpaA|nr:A24 family peptidase [Candidatus Udaeobacter sp.]
MTLNVPLLVAVPAILVAAVATGADVRARRIPNWLTFPALFAGIALHAMTGGLSGAGNAAFGVLVAGGVLLPGWYMGWMAAGDVKLCAAVGAFLGYPLALMMVLLSLMAGGLLSLAVAARHRVLRRSLFGAAILGAWAANSVAGSAPPPVTSGIRFPFAAAVLCGVACSLCLRT